MLRFYCDSDFVFTAVFVVSRVSLLLWFFTVPRTSFLLRILANLGPRSCCGFCCDSGFVLVAAFTVSRTSFLLQSLSCLGLRPCCSFCRVSDFVLAAVFAMSWVSYLLQFLPCLGLRFTATPASFFAVSRSSLPLWFCCVLDLTLAVVFTVSRSGFVLGAVTTGPRVAVQTFAVPPHVFFCWSVPWIFYFVLLDAVVLPFDNSPASM